MYHRVLSSVAIAACLAFPVIPATAKTLSRAENVQVPSAGITKIVFQDMEFTDITYRGSSSPGDFSLRLEKRASNGDERKLERLLSEIRLETRVSGSTLEVRVSHPKWKETGILDRWFNRSDRRIVLEVTGPSRLDVDIHDRFSKVRTFSTSGDLSLNTDFSDTDISDHQGFLRAHAGFGTIRGENIRGGFNMDTNFSHVSLMLSGLERDSRINISFGDAEIGIPQNAGVVFRSSKSFGGISFDVNGTLTPGESPDNRRVLNNGGPDISLNADFGNIHIRDNYKTYQTAEHQFFRKDAALPLNTGAWWKYTRNNEVLTLRVETTRSGDGQSIATLSFDPPISSPFGSIDVYETPRGLYLSRINRAMYGKELTGITLDPPQLWLPYSLQDSPVMGGDLLGTVRMIETPDSVDTPAGKMGNVITWRIENGNGETHSLQLVPGVGFISFDDTWLTGYDLSGRAPDEEPEEIIPPVPEFEKGVIKTITIQGDRLHSEKYIRRQLNLQEGQTYTRAEIDAATRRLEENKRIDYVSYSVDSEGNLTVRIYQTEPFSHEFGGDASFNRAAGLGLGPNLRISSKVAPISEINGYARYNWGVDDWAWGAGAHRDFFDANCLRIGGGYRSDYGSSMDWAIPQIDASLNAFILGYSAENYFRFEEGTAFISQSWGERLIGRVELFDAKYFSMSKNTDWSLFHRKKTKETNAPLDPDSENWITGFRSSLDIGHQGLGENFHSRIEVERSFQYHTSAYPNYTRLFAEAECNAQYWYGQLIKLRLAGGYSSHVLPDQRSFRLGGINTLRGFPTMSVPVSSSGATPFTSAGGGERMFLMNLDYFYGEDLSIIFFGDLGGVWRKGESASAGDLKRDIGVGLAFDGDFFSNSPDDEHKAGFRVNWAVPVGNESHVSRWTVNFVREY